MGGREKNEDTLTDAVSLTGLNTEKPEMRVSPGITAGVVLAPCRHIYRHAALYAECVFKFGSGDSLRCEGVVDGSWDADAAVKVACDTVARVKTTVIQVQCGLVPWVQAVADDAEGARAVAVGDVGVNRAVVVGDVDVNEVLCFPKTTMRSDGSGSALFRGEGSCHELADRRGACGGRTKHESAVEQKEQNSGQESPRITKRDSKD